MGQKRILLRLVEAMDLINEQYGLARAVSLLVLRLFDSRANFFDAGQNRGQRFKMTVTGLGNDPGQGSFTHTRRSPQNHGMGLLFLDGFTNGFA